MGSTGRAWFPIEKFLVVHEYFKKDLEGLKVLVQVNPASLAGMELVVHKDGDVEKRKLQFDEDIYDDLEADGFEQASALEFNLYLKGLV